jgi:hypothetical protein
MIKINLKGVPTKYMPKIKQAIHDLLLESVVDESNCDELIAICRWELFQTLKEQGNLEMLRRLRSRKYIYYLLRLNHTRGTLKIIPCSVSRCCYEASETDSQLSNLIEINT